VNFLAHLYLSGNSDGIKMGNFIADHVKGNDYNNYPIEIKNGILLHRKIDSFTDSHSIVKHSKSFLQPKYHKYSGVIIDIFYDHFLSTEWYDFSEQNLNEYIDSIYDLLKEKFEVLPDDMKRFIPNFIKNDWLKLYQTIEGVESVLIGMSKGTSLPDETTYAIQILRHHYNEFKKDFLDFFPDLIDCVNS
jgi:acyl carrier protein phosphodiesterase